MSNIVSINGYPVQYHNGEPEIDDLSIADRLEYAQHRDIRKLIKRMINNGQLTESHVRATVARLPNGIKSTAYYLTEKGCLKVIVKSETKMADEITDEIIDVFIAARKDATRPRPVRSRYVDPLIEREKQGVEVVRSRLRVAKLLGTDVPMARAIAVDAAKAEVGIDYTPMLAHNSVQDAPLTPTELGRRLGIDKGRIGMQVNAELERLGLQAKEGNEWRPTEKGRPYCTVNPYKSPNGDHSGYRVLWYPSVTKFIRLQ